MDKTIYKYQLKVVDKQVILLPSPFTILHLGLQNGEPYIWAMIPRFTRDCLGKELTLITNNTGHIIPEKEYNSTVYLGTYILGDYVGHVFQEV